MNIMTNLKKIKVKNKVSKNQRLIILICKRPPRDAFILMRLMGVGIVFSPLC